MTHTGRLLLGTKKASQPTLFELATSAQLPSNSSVVPLVALIVADQECNLFRSHPHLNATYAVIQPRTYLVIGQRATVANTKSWVGNMSMKLG